MIAAALVIATVSSGRSMLAHQWLLVKAVAEKYLTYSIFYLNLAAAAAAQMVCFKISRACHYSFVCE
jgi:hypothetical protein